MPVTLDDLVSALDAHGCKPKKHGVEWYARCPVHGGRDWDSLSATEREGKLLVRCHSKQCSFMDVLGSLGLDPDSAIPEPPPIKPDQNELKLVATYTYTDNQGNLLFQVLKYKKNDGSKTFRQRRPDGKGGWEWKLGKTPRVLYNLEEVSRAVRENKTIFVVEGEKDVETLRNHGLIATCNPGGACTRDEAWLPAYIDSLSGARLVIIPDNDDSGETHAQIVLRRMYGNARTVRIVRLPDLEQKEDVSDWITKGHTVQELRHVIRDANMLPITTMYDFLRMDIPERPWVLEPLIKKGDLLEIHSWRGTGKTQLAVGMSMAIAAGGQIMHWKSPEPQGVVYVEGEMSTDEMKKRFLKQAGGMDITDDQYKELIKNFILLQHEVLSRYGIRMKSLRSIEGLNELEIFIADLIEFSPINITTLVIDNLSCLHGGDENDATTWENFKHFLVRMRVMGVSVIVLHHSAKSGVSRGHSTMEDQLDVVLKLDSKKYINEEGAKFDIRFEKARGLSGKAAKSFTAHMQDGEDGLTSCWFQVKKSKGGSFDPESARKMERIGELRGRGWSYDQIATEMRMSKHTVAKYARALDDNQEEN